MPQEDGLCEEVCKPPYGELGNGCEEPWDELYIPGVQPISLVR